MTCVQETGHARPSFTSSYLEEKRTPTPADEELIKAAAASLYSGQSHYRELHSMHSAI